MLAAVPESAVLSAISGFVEAFSALVGLLLSFRYLRAVLPASSLLTLAVIPGIILAPEFPLYDQAFPFPVIRFREFALAICALRGVMAGILVGSVASAGVEALHMSCRLIDLFRGAQLAEQLAPLLGVSETHLERFSGVLAIAWALQIGAHHKALIACTHLLSSLHTKGMQHVFRAESLLPLLHALISSLEIAILLAAPTLLISILADAATLSIARSMSAVNFSFELIPIRLLAGLAVILIAVYCGSYGKSFEGMAREFGHLNDIISIGR